MAGSENQMDHTREPHPSRDIERIGVCRALAYPDRLSPYTQEEALPC